MAPTTLKGNEPFFGFYVAMDNPELSGLSLQVGGSDF